LEKETQRDAASNLCFSSVFPTVLKSEDKADGVKMVSFVYKITIQSKTPHHIIVSIYTDGNILIPFHIQS
jgi:hypothetical protein